ncbi:hypothetical protein OJ998_20190 [Solirubrobacter taibaiensis]|nr:hypothetical protein [Solirubrobacter taibaiensis]
MRWSLACLLLAVAGCGDRELPATLSAQEVQADPAARAADRYLQAGAEGDMRTACELHTPEELVEQGGDGTIETCVAQGEALDAEIRSATEEIFAAGAITRVERVDERTRIVQFAIDPEQVSEFAGQDLEVKLGRLTMVRSDGAWRLDEYEIGAT